MATEPYRRPSRIYTGPVEAVFPFNLTDFVKLPPEAVFKSLSIDAIHVHYTRDRMVEHQFPADMRAFNRCVLPMASPETVFFVGGAWFDTAADRIGGLVPALDFRLEYDPRTGLVNGTVQPLRAPFADGAPTEPLPVTLLTLGYCVQYHMPDLLPQG